MLWLKWNLLPKKLHLALGLELDLKQKCVFPGRTEGVSFSGDGHDFFPIGVE
jgi:hypothetical protein